MEFNEVFVTEDMTVIEALKKLDLTAKRVLFVINSENKLVAALSDGDIRRWLLKKGNLYDPVSKLANYTPKYVKKGETENAREYMKLYHVDALPVVDNDKKIVDVIFLYTDDKNSTENINIPVVIMAGGKGTRLYPYTKILPKPLIPIGDIPISEHIVNRFHRCGCNYFLFIVNYKKNMIKAYYNEVEKDYTIEYIDEDEPLGTGGGLSLLKGKIKSTFILTNCDTIINEDFSKILRAHKEQKNFVTMICSLRNYQVPYGVVKIGENGSIDEMTEKPFMSFFTNTGTYIVEPEVIDAVEPGKVIGFPDVIQKLKEQGENVGVYPINENSWLDMGQFDTMEDMKEKLHVKE